METGMHTKLTLIELNEVNFEIVREYINEKKGNFLGFEQLLSFNYATTSSEEEYDLIEPWIQWPSVHTECTYAEHKIFRLGDGVNLTRKQIFEKIEDLGFKVGCVSPMNTTNRLKDPAFFIPDPWTNTLPDNSILSRSLHKAIQQAVNDNSKGDISLWTYLVIIWALLFKTKLSNWPTYITLFRNRRKRWNKALFLDLLLSDIFIKLRKKSNADFSTLFLNSFAHVQHHYILNSKFYNGKLENPTDYISKSDDPILDAMHIYDKILRNILLDRKQAYICATGLQQVPVSEQVNYFRLKNHKSFLQVLGVENFEVYPRMTRDFLVVFNDPKALDVALEKLKQITFDGIPLFDNIEIRDNSLFVTLTYSKLVSSSDLLEINGVKLNLKDEFVFVALKNGHHSPIGHVLTNFSPSLIGMTKTKHVKYIGTEIYNFFRELKGHVV
jgi:hypothetical protein